MSIKRKILVALGVVVLLLTWQVASFMTHVGVFTEVQPHLPGTCKPVSVTGAEDLVIDHRTGIAYLSAYDRRAVDSGSGAVGGIYSYNMNAPESGLTNLTPKESISFNPHGVSLLHADDATFLFVINHYPAQHHSVRVYEVVGGRLILRREVTSDSLVSPNDLYAVGPSQFYITNDHRHTDGPLAALETFGRMGWSNVLFFDGADFSEAASGMAFANSIAGNADDTALLVTASGDEEILVFDRDAESNELALRERIHAGSRVDNIDLGLPGEFWVGSHPQALKLLDAMENSGVRAPAQVFRLIYRSEGDYDLEEVFADDGALISSSSGASWYNGRILMASLAGDHVLDCALDEYSAQVTQQHSAAHPEKPKPSVDDPFEVPPYPPFYQWEPSRNWLTDPNLSNEERWLRVETMFGGMQGPMMEVGQRYVIFHDAVMDENYRMAIDIWAAIARTMVNAFMIRPEFKKAGDAMFLRTQWFDMFEALRSKDRQRILDELVVTRDTCMSCHQATGVDWANKQRVFEMTAGVRSLGSGDSAGAAAEPGDIERGAKLFRACGACHAIQASAEHGIGPNLTGLFSRTFGRAPGYEYSDALGSSGLSVTEQNLDSWLQNSAEFVEGSQMIYPDIGNAQERKDLIAYLRHGAN